MWGVAVEAGGVCFPRIVRRLELDCEVVQIELRALRLRRARQWGACWLALRVWERIGGD